MSLNKPIASENDYILAATPLVIYIINASDKKIVLTYFFSFKILYNQQNISKDIFSVNLVKSLFHTFKD